MSDNLARSETRSEPHENSGPVQPDITARRSPAAHLVATRWLPGQSGNPAGKPKGGRTRFSDAFFYDIADDWQRGGAEAIERVRNDDPSTYLRVCAALMPREVSIATTRELSEGELESQLSAALALLGGVTIEGVALPAGEPVPVAEADENG